MTTDTPILCADLIWRPAGSLRLGQEIVAFDEDPNFGDNRRVARRYRTATVETNALKLMSCSRVSTDIGDPIVASHDHPWLVWAKNRSRERIFFRGHAGRNTPRTAGLEWKPTSALHAGDKVAFLSRPWVTENSRSAGWLAGMFDGEGSVSKATGDQRLPHYKINISQNPGLLLDRLRNELGKRDFSFYENRRSCPQLVLTGGWTETLRFLGQIAPDRLVAKIPTIMAELPGLFRDKTFTLAEVTGIEPVNDQPGVSMRTSRYTFIASGYLSHSRTDYYITCDTNGTTVRAPRLGREEKRPRPDCHPRHRGRPADGRRPYTRPTKRPGVREPAQAGLEGRQVRPPLHTGRDPGTGTTGRTPSGELGNLR